jgi:hypothetical protein
MRRCSECFLGDAADYLVRIDMTDVVLRVAVPPSLRVAVGEVVTLAIASESCAPLPVEE